MKICQTCQQQFPNGFQYCPTDTDFLITSEEYFRRTKPLIQAPVAETKLPPVTEPIPPPRPATAELSRTIAEEPTAALPFRNTESVARREVLPSSVPPPRPVARPQAPPQPLADKPRNLAQPLQPVSQPLPTQPLAPPSQELPRMNAAPPSQVQTNGGQAQARQAQPPASQVQATVPAAAALSFSLPESGGLLERLKNALRNYSDSFSKGGPPVRPGEMGDFRFLLREESLTARVGRELRNAGEDLKRDPKGFVVATLRGEGSSKQRQRWLLNGTAMAVIAYSFLFFIVPAIALLMGWTKRAEEVAKEEPSLEKLVDLAAIPLEAKAKDVQKELKNKAGGSKPKPQAAKGGGGGGRQQPTPPSKGVPPQMALTPQIIPPNPEPPKIKNPSLVVASTVYGDPKALPQMKGPIGAPDGVPAPPAPGPGKGAGIGTGAGTGVGQGQGGGVGAGRGGNVGGGDMDLGGGRGGIEEMGKNGVGRPTITYKEKAKYTEEARQNKIQGTVVLSVIFTADGRITNIRVVRGLPDGLTEKAIEAAQKIRFQPATKNGGPVSVRGNLEFTFNLY